MSEAKGVIQPAVKKETLNVLAYTAIGVVLMYIGFLLVKFLAPIEFKIPFNYTVILGGIAGGAVAVLNFFLMALAVQNVASCEDDKEAVNIMRKSYSKRMALQLLWLIVALIAPCFNVIAGVLPLLFPTLGIKAMGIIKLKISLRQEVERKQDGD